MNPPFRREERLIDADPRPLGQRVPEPLHERVEQLCERVYNAGAVRRPSKMEMIAALLYGSPTDPDELRQLLEGYGRATVADALVEEAGDDQKVIDLPRRKSGPRSPRGS